MGTDGSGSYVTGEPAVQPSPGSVMPSGPEFRAVSAGQQQAVPAAQPAPPPSQGWVPQGSPVVQGQNPVVAPPPGWQAQVPYPAGMGPVYGQKPKRPGAATGAGVLGIVGGSLGVIAFFRAASRAVNLREKAYGGYYGDLGEVMASLGTLQVFGVLAAMIALLVAGITFLSRHGYMVLFVSAVAQAVLSVLGMVLTFLDANLMGYSRIDPSGAAGAVIATVIFEMIGVGMAVAILILLCRPAVKQWKNIRV